EDGAVTVEGHFVGKLTGVRFEAAQGGSVLEEKALRAAATHAVGPEIARRLGKLAAEPDEAFALSPDGTVLWQGEVAGVLGGGEPFRPRVRLLGDLGPEPARQRAAQRLEAFVAHEAGRRLAGLKALEAAVAEGRIKGLARGLAWRLIEAGGVVDRALVRAEVRSLSQVERRTLRGLGVRLGAFSVFLPGLLKPEARALTEALTRRDVPGWRPPTGALSRLPAHTPPPRALSAFGLRAVRGLAVPVEQLERLDELLRAGARAHGGQVLSEQAREELGWREDEAAAILKGLGFAAVRRPGEPTAWRRRFERDFAVEVKPAAQANSPFAALAALHDAPAPQRRKRRRRPVKARQNG
ncbi:MAG: phosphonate-binding protein, partial [Proteobacteria bacterium]|nr:phosphonate-binding protein [Pseudomonadota bacterium]